jgi:polysaccharide export outer membrane protein
MYGVYRRKRANFQLTVIALGLLSVLSFECWMPNAECSASDTPPASAWFGDTSAQYTDYRLGPGDVISITVDSIPEISSQYTISEAGAIVFPTLLSPLQAQGSTVEELRNLLVEILTEYMYEPKVTVTIVEYHSHKVLVLGPFHRPGKYELKREKVPLLDIITEAGGLRDLKENDELVILRNPETDGFAVREGSDSTESKAISALATHRSSFLPELQTSLQPIRIDLQKLLRQGDLTQNVMVGAGDVIYLTSFFAAEEYVYVAGGRRRGAGAIPYEPDLTAFKALLRAGVVPDDPQMSELIIVRGQTGSDKFISAQVKFDPENAEQGSNSAYTGDVTLLPEDIVILPESTSQVVYVAGKVSRPGALPFKEGLTVLQAILDAGGMIKEAVGSKVKVLREDALAGRTQIPVDLDAILEKGNKAQNITLVSGDIIVVPGMSLQEDIMVTGKVSNPGMVPYEEGITAMKAVLMAGGLSSNAIRSQIRIMSRDGNIHPPFPLDISSTTIGETGKSNPVLNPGDLIVVLGGSPDNIISVLGKVRRPGIIEYEDGLTALQAVLRAGGFDQGAARSKVKIVRGEGQQQQNLRANLESLMEKGDRSEDITLLPGDIVVVPQTFF